MKDEKIELNDKHLRILNEQRILFDRVFSANRKLEDKASTILRSGSLITGLVAAAKIALGNMSSWWSIGILAFIFTLFLFMLYFSMRVWLPRDKMLPIKSDWDSIFMSHVYADDYEEYKLTLANYTDATELALAENDTQSRFVQGAGICLGLQVALLVFLLFVP